MRLAIADGDVVGELRRWMPDLADLDARRIHEPAADGDSPDGDPAPIVDHAAERAEAMARDEALRR